MLLTTLGLIQLQCVTCILSGNVLSLGIRQKRNIRGLFSYCLVLFFLYHHRQRAYQCAACSPSAPFLFCTVILPRMRGLYLFVLAGANMYKTGFRKFTKSGGSLGSCVDEERSKLRELM